MKLKALVFAQIVFFIFFLPSCADTVSSEPSSRPEETPVASSEKTESLPSSQKKTATWAYDGTTEYFVIEKDIDFITITGANGKSIFATHVNSSEVKLESTLMRGVRPADTPQAEAALQNAAPSLERTFFSEESADEKCLSHEELDSAIRESILRAQNFSRDLLPDPQDDSDTPTEAEPEAGSENPGEEISEGGETESTEQAEEEQVNDWEMVNVHDYNEGDTETFFYYHIKRGDNDEVSSTLEKKQFILLSAQEGCNVWADSGDSYYKSNVNRITKKAGELASWFYNGYLLVSHIYGKAPDYIFTFQRGYYVPYAPIKTYSVTGDKINIMLSSMLEDGKIYGFITSADFIHYSPKQSNEGLFLYIDSQTLLENPGEAKFTALHEFSHTISTNIKRFRYQLSWETWYGEMLAMLCEDMMQEYIGVHDSDIMADSPQGGLGTSPKARIGNANYKGCFTGLSADSTSATYAASFRFGAWLVRKFGGVRLLKEIETNASVNIKSILTALKELGHDYTLERLLTEYAGDLIKEEAFSGLNQNAPTYTQDEFVCAYHDLEGQSHIYNYPFSAINLWADLGDDSAYFYDWADVGGLWKVDGQVVAGNEKIPMSKLPSGNIYSNPDAYRREGAVYPGYAFHGPAFANSGLVTATIGPRSYFINKVCDVKEDSVTLKILNNNEKCKDTLSVWVK